MKPEEAQEEIERRRDHLKSAVGELRDRVGEHLGPEAGRSRWLLPVLAGTSAFVLAQIWRRRRRD